MNILDNFDKIWGEYWKKKKKKKNDVVFSLQNDIMRIAPTDTKMKALLHPIFNWIKIIKR